MRSMPNFLNKMLFLFFYFCHLRDNHVTGTLKGSDNVCTHICEFVSVYEGLFVCTISKQNETIMNDFINVSWRTEQILLKLSDRNNMMNIDNWLTSCSEPNSKTYQSQPTQKACISGNLTDIELELDEVTADSDSQCTLPSSNKLYWIRQDIAISNELVFNVQV